jgi:hypothetical protein
MSKIPKLHFLFVNMINTDILLQTIKNKVTEYFDKKLSKLTIKILIKIIKPDF